MFKHKPTRTGKTGEDTTANKLGGVGVAEKEMDKG